MSETAPILDYGDSLTRRGVSCRTTPDGVRIIVPYRDDLDRILQQSPPWMKGVAFCAQTALNLLLLPLSIVLGSPIWLNKVRSTPGVVVEVTHDELIVTDGREHSALISRWPRSAVGEFRPNRFDRMMLVRVPGVSNQDVLAGLDDELLMFISDQVTPLLPGARPTAGDSVVRDS